MAKIKVAVLMGGKTPEHEISLISGREVVRNLPKKYSVFPVVISRDGSAWKTLTSKKLLSLPDPLSLKGTKKEYLSSSGTEISIKDLINNRVDVVFIAMHGLAGEDGTVQGMLELYGIPYTGSGILASALGMDKFRFKKILEAEKLPIPRYTSIYKGDKVGNIYKLLGDPPYCVKPHNQGSSVGISILEDINVLQKSLELAYKYSDLAIIENYIKGVEVTCGVIGNKNPKALPLVEIIPLKGDFFDYDSKYTESGAEEIVPARLSVGLTKKIQNMAIEVYKLIGCSGFSRVDFILRKNKYPTILEVNTIPGLTPMSLFPKSAKAAGIPYSQLLDKLLIYANE